jgi:hypothetical protein
VLDLFRLIVPSLRTETAHRVLQMKALAVAGERPGEEVDRVDDGPRRPVWFGMESRLRPAPGRATCRMPPIDVSTRSQSVKSRLRPPRLVISPALPLGNYGSRWEQYKNKIAHPEQEIAGENRLRVRELNHCCAR